MDFKRKRPRHEYLVKVPAPILLCLQNQKIQPMQVKIFGCAIECLDTTTITIELSLEKGHHRVISGLADDAVKESLARIEAAVNHSGFFVPESKMVYNLHPAAMRKSGAHLDLPMAIALLAASGQVLNKTRLDQFLFAGELSLDGSIQPVQGALSLVLHGWKEKFGGVVVPFANVEEAALVTKIPVYGVNSLEETVQFLNGQVEIKPYIIDTRKLFYTGQNEFDIDYSDVRGQGHAVRAMEIAAAGSHNAIMIGPPGSGKSMIAQRLNTILPPLSLNEALEVTRIKNICGEKDVIKGLVNRRPFVSGHYSISVPGLIGGGSVIMPGLITKAHNGVLFLDELAEYSRGAIESVRIPLETGEIKVTRSMKTVSFPASFILLAATNPCPCGYFNHVTRTCSCSPKAIQKYLNKISGPLLDRLDLCVEVMSVSASELTDETPSESSSAIRERVISAREIQTKRFRSHDGVHNNSQMTPPLIKKYCHIEADAAELLISAIQHMQLSGRAHNRIMKVSRTIADLEHCETIRFCHVSEAIGYRSLDKESWIAAAATKEKKVRTSKHIFKIA